MFILIEIIYFAIPVAALAFFVVSLMLFLSARKKNKILPGSVDEGTMRIRKAMMIVSAVVAGILIVITVGFALLLTMSISYM